MSLLVHIVTRWVVIVSFWGCCRSRLLQLVSEVEDDGRPRISSDASVSSKVLKLDRNVKSCIKVYAIVTVKILIKIFF